jgi:hypothetical protein
MTHSLIKLSKGKNMDAKLKKIQITPMKFDKQGDVQREEFATLTIEVPMDSTGQRAAIIRLCELLDQEWVVVDVEGKTIVAVNTA